MKQKYIIKQIPPESAELAFYFDGDTFTPAAGGIEYALFILFSDRWRTTVYPEQNRRTWDDLTRAASELMEGITAAADGWTDYDGRPLTVKSAMIDAGLKYSPRAAHRLKKWAADYDGDTDSAESIAEYLTITTGRPWTVTSARGYCQGDYADIVYCADVYSEQDATAAGEIALGAANEYSITDLDEAGNELDTVYGYIVADCQAWGDDDIKKLICSWEGIDPADAELRLIDGQTTRTEYSYRIA